MERIAFNIKVLKQLIGFILLFGTGPVRSMSDGGSSADMSRVLSTILEGHKPSVLPRVNQSGPVNVQIGMGVMAVVNLVGPQ
ncbi:hypothetical protein ElyMa_001353400 [Elysia marginata]|uniref:Uncharacterized protein n=1 Tax=Elysia marginata TaxID=1093978 RepID=A0AAV4INL4_9GAST|nr:hypothetical protein ElyMa_001353400 [Elysia marginata]